ncbi:metallophosphoesterase [Paenibacillus sp. JCM 10914]|uniref:metallophosphoesterase n=1 Tax=Paenibacillus sp. JCM 10914 TaxID=1236974 RepID=UPI00056D37B5|nr:metallophosphoesterase [Paenibacillus sp. JCM 10914]
MFIFVGIIVLLVYGLLVYYIGRSVWSWMRPGPSIALKIVYIVVLTVVSTSFITGRFLGNWTVMNVIGSYWMAIFYVLIVLLPFMHVMLWLLRLTTLNRDRTEKTAGAAVLILMVVLIGVGSFNAYSPTVRAYDVNIPKNAGALEHLNIVMASDMHFGVLSGKAHAERMVQEINALEPDLVLFPGDIIDDDLDAYLNQGIDQILTGIQAPYGVIASLGNHDRFKGEISELIEALEHSGMTVLYDETLEVEDLVLVGRRDKQDRERADLSEIMQEVDRNKPILALDHQPNALDEAQQAGVDLIVSGHTHRGQVFPAHLITSAIFENDWGYLQKGQMHSIVSSGYGFWGPPIRLGSRSEIVQIQVTFQP